MNYNRSLAWAAGKKCGLDSGYKNFEQWSSYSRNFSKCSESDYSLCRMVAFDMFENANCLPAVADFDGKVYVRLSAQIYN